MKHLRYFFFIQRINHVDTCEANRYIVNVNIECDHLSGRPGTVAAMVLAVWLYIIHPEP